jgi:hypothetical protein
LAKIDYLAEPLARSNHPFQIGLFELCIHEETVMSTSTYLVFGDLHGRILYAFRFASVWAREHEIPVSGILQVGDLGYFPDLSKLDKATLRHAKDDPTELGAQDIIQINELADEIFNDSDCPETMWFTSGNHEDFEALKSLSQSSGRQTDFVVDAYCKIRCVKDGQVASIPEKLQVGALWGVDGESPNGRKNLPSCAYISERSATQLLGESLDVLLTHDAPMSAKRTNCGSEIISTVIQLQQPPFAFFGHYRGEGSKIEQDFGKTQVYHMSGFELGGKDGLPEFGSVGILTWDGEEGEFNFVDESFLNTFSRYNWKYR